MAPPQQITDVLKQIKAKYIDILSDAEQFFAEFESTVLLLEKETTRKAEAEHQLETIIAFEKNNGYYPEIKDQPDTKLYLGELQNIIDKTKATIKSLRPRILGGYRRRTLMLNELADIIIEQTLNERDANRFITTLVLRSPLPKVHSRCPNNEKSKPIYIAAWSACLFQKLVHDGLIDDEFILSKVPEMVPSQENPDVLEPDPNMLNEYIRDVLRPLIIASLIHQIGSHSLEANQVYKGNRYRLLNDEEREVLIRAIFDNSLKYLEHGLGKPDRGAFDDQAADEYQLELSRYELIEDILTNYVKANHALGNLLRIPMIYASFLLSTKPKHDFAIVYKAYDILKSGIDKDIIYKPYADKFLEMVGRFPLGSGIYFISKETGQPEKAVVIGMNPPSPDSAIVKQLTRRQIKYDDFSQTEVTYEYNLFNFDARKKSDFGSAYFEKQFPKGFGWNPAEFWEIEINQDTFWRRDNNLKVN